MEWMQATCGPSLKARQRDVLWSGFLSTKCPKWASSQRQEGEGGVPGGGGEWVWLPNGVPLEADANILELDGGDGCTTLRTH